MKNLYLLPILLCFLFAGCTSVPKLLENGEFEKAYAKARKHCTRDRAPKIKHLEQFLDAYAAVQARDYAHTTEILRRSGSDKWAPLYELYSDLHKRSLDLVTIAPRARELERHPELLPATLEAQREDARKKAGDHYLALVRPLLQPALAGEKPAAREAWSLHQKVAYFLPERNSEFKRLRTELQDIGTLRVLLYAGSGEFDYELTQGLRRFKRFDRGWTTILTQAAGERIDLEAEVSFTHYSENLPTETCNTIQYEKEVLDWVERKKVKERINDSTVVEKIVVIEHYKTVYASVTECQQEAGACAFGEVRTYLPGSEQPEWISTLSSWKTWSNTYRFSDGDARALPACPTQGGYQYPPSLHELLSNAVTAFPHHARNQLIRQYAPRKSIFRDLARRE
ncbi:hypothetical protein [Neolewinella persica]|uniref:hypothetical protein n=1 Tax=Neolewinella persica TaxID=70998 RepID=UPI0003609376|nr:hypothetical protein [Neolewinella persica]